MRIRICYLTFSLNTDWRRVFEVDLEHVVNAVDIRPLQDNINNITFSDFHENDLAVLSEEANALQLIRLSQLTIEYQLNVQDYLLEQRTRAESEIERLRAENAEMASLLEQQRGKIINLKKALKTKKNTPPPLTLYPCTLCPSTFSTAEFLSAHITRRHETPAPVSAVDSELAQKLLREVQEARDVLSADVRTIQDMLNALTCEFGAGQDEVLNELRIHVDRRTEDVLDEIMQLNGISDELTHHSRPTSPTPPRRYEPEQSDDYDPYEEKKQRLRRVLERHAKLKYIWFKDLPYLKARYPAPPANELMSMLQVHEDVAHAQTEKTLQTLEKDSQKHGFDEDYLRNVTDTLVAKYFDAGPREQIRAKVESLKAEQKEDDRREVQRRNSLSQQHQRPQTIPPQSFDQSHSTTQSPYQSQYVPNLASPYGVPQN